MLNVPATVGFAVPTAGGEGEGYQAPTIMEFFPPQIFGVDTVWGPTRINLIGLFMAGVLALFFVMAMKKQLDEMTQNLQKQTQQMHTITEFSTDVMHIHSKEHAN